MKKLIMTILVLPLMFSCSDNNMVSNQEELNTNNVIGAPEPVPVETLVTSNKIIKIVVADLMGAVKGYREGGWVGAVIQGVVSSLTEALTNYQTVALPVNFESFKLNDQNPYEFMGLAHYQLINSEFTGSRVNFSNFRAGLSIPYKTSTQVFLKKNNHEHLPSNEAPAAFAVFEANYQDNEAFFHASDETKDAFVAQSISPEAFIIFKEYKSTFLNSERVITFVNKSMDIEKMVVANTMLSENDKKILLTAMSTTRIGVQYWGTVLRN